MTVQHPQTTASPPEGVGPGFGLLDSAALDRAPYGQRWLVESVLVPGQPAVLGGPRKSLKTSVAIDLAVSLSAGVPFLGSFAVPRPVRALVLSGESGEAVVQETARRAC